MNIMSTSLFKLINAWKPQHVSGGDDSCSLNRWNRRIVDKHDFVSTKLIAKTNTLQHDPVAETFRKTDFFLKNFLSQLSG